ncbi:MAG: AI-2E family transporter [Lachnospiraceae bacterium]|nr:AI-2E family transporter [Lachnospiraceae bacterium]
MKEERKNLASLVVLITIACLVVKYWESITHWGITMFSVLTPLLTGCMIAYVVNILMRFYESKLSIPKGKRAICMLLAFGSIVVIFVLVMSLIVPELESCVVMIVYSIPKALEQGWMMLESNEYLARLLSDANLQELQTHFDWKAITTGVLQWLRNGVGNSIFGYLTSVFSIIFNLLMALIFSMYLLAGKEKIANQVKRLVRAVLKEKWSSKFYYVVKVMDSNFHNFIVGQCVEAVILGTLCMIGMTICRFPYAMMIGVMIGCTALIPVAGAYIGATLGAIMIFTVSPMKALLFVIFIVILQQIEGQVIYPKVVGSSIGLPGVWVFAAVVAGGGLFGVTGILFGIPIVASVYHILKDHIA